MARDCRDVDAAMESRDRKPASIPAEVFGERVSDLMAVKSELADHTAVAAHREALDDDARPNGWVDVRSLRELKDVEALLAAHDLRIDFVQQHGECYGGHEGSVGELFRFLDAGSVSIAFSHADS